MTGEDSGLGFKVKGLITNANYSVKKLQFLLFINRKSATSFAMFVTSATRSEFPKELFVYPQIAWLTVVPSRKQYKLSIQRISQRVLILSFT